MAMRPTNSSVQRSSTTKRCARKTIGFDRSKPRNIVSKSVAKKNVSRYSNIVCETIDSESSGDDASDDTENISRDKDNKKNTDRKKGRYSSKKSSVVESSGDDEKELSADDDDESTESECNDHNEIDKNKKTIKQKRANKTSKSKKKKKSKKKDKSKQKGKSKKKVIGQKRKFRCKQLKFRSGKKQRIDSRYKKKYAKDFILKLNPYTDIRCKVKFYAPEKHAPKLVASYYDKHPDSDRDSDVNETLFYGEMKVDKKTNSKRIELFCYCDANMVIGSKGRGDDDYFCNACNKRIPRNTSFLFCTQSDAGAIEKYHGFHDCKWEKDDKQYYNEKLANFTKSVGCDICQSCIPAVVRDANPDFRYRSIHDLYWSVPAFLKEITKRR